MFAKLRGKLTFFMVLVSGLTIMFAGFFIDGALDKQFSAFLESAQAKRNLQVVQAIKDLYGQMGEMGLESQLELLSQATDLEITIVSEMNPPQMGRHMMGRHGPMQMHRQTTETITLPEGGEAIINVVPTFAGESGVDEAAFRQAVNQSIFSAALLSVGAALLLSTFFSWGLTRPLNQLLAVVRRFGQGDLQQEVQIKGRDELSYLGQEFNQMAHNLRKMDEFRVKLTNDLAHELRTPLASVQAYVEAMWDGVLEPSKDNLASVLEETGRLNTLIKDLQELAKVEMPLKQQERIDLEKLAQDALASLAILAEEKSIRLDLQSVGPLYIRGHGEMLATALRNLVENAIKYTLQNGRITVSVLNEGQWSLVRITDTGIGIEAQELPLIFERFYRTDLSRSRATGGTGIGLAITSEIVKGHGGRIDVQSEVGVGSTFTVRLPKIEE